MVNNIDEQKVREMFNISEDNYYLLNGVYRDILIEKYVKYLRKEQRSLAVNKLKDFRKKINKLQEEDLAKIIDREHEKQKVIKALCRR